MTDELTRIPCVIGGRSAPDDWSIVYQGHEIGRIHKNHGRDGATAWAWSFNSSLADHNHGSAGSFDDAKEQFRHEWTKLSDYAKALAKGRPVRKSDE